MKQNIGVQLPHPPENMLVPRILGKVPQAIKEGNKIRGQVSKEENEEKKTKKHATLDIMPEFRNKCLNASQRFDNAREQ